MTSRSQVSPDNLCSVDVTVIILCAPFFIFYIRAPTNFDGEKQQHTGPLVGQDKYENDDCDADGDGKSGEDVNRTGGNMTPTECRSNKEVCRVLPHGEPTNASHMSTSVPPSLSWNPLSHPSLPAPTATYHPTATLPTLDQHLSSLTSPHTSTPNQNPTAHPTKHARREQQLSAPHCPPLQRVPQHPPFPTACPQPRRPAILPLRIQPCRRSHLPHPLRQLHQPRAQRRPVRAVPVPPEQPEHLPPHKHRPGTQPVPHHCRPRTAPIPHAPISTPGPRATRHLQH